MNTVVPPSNGVHVPDPRRIPETMASTKPYTYYVFSHMYVPMKKFSFYIKHCRILTTGTNNKLEKLQ